MFIRQSILAGSLGLLLAGWSDGLVGAEIPQAPTPESAPQIAKEDHPEKARPDRRRTREDFERLREEWDRLTPEEREARKKAFFEKKGKPMFSRKEFEKRCRELEGFSPEQRRAEIQKWRERELALRERFERNYAELRIKQKEGSLDEEESERLERMEVLAKRFEQTRKHRYGRRPGPQPGNNRETPRPKDGSSAE